MKGELRNMSQLHPNDENGPRAKAQGEDPRNPRGRPIPARYPGLERRADQRGVGFGQTISAGGGGHDQREEHYRGGRAPTDDYIEDGGSGRLAE